MMRNGEPDTPPFGGEWRNFYGRRHGKTLRPAQQRALAGEMDRYRLTGVSPAENPARAPIDLAALAGGRPVWLEVGFGSGEHLLHLSGGNRESFCIGCEPFVNGVATLLSRLGETPRSNLAIHPDDVREFFDVLPDASLARCYLLYPDPWPKARHHERRFVTPGYLAALARVMAPAAPLMIATDIADYVRQALEEVPRHGFGWTARHPGDWRAPWPDWHRTRYEAKAIREGRRPHYLTFLRGPGAS